MIDSARPEARNRALAVDGGPPVRTDALPPWPNYESDEIAAVTEVLRSAGVNQWNGPDVRAFEDEFRRYLDVEHAVAVANGTLSLELILAAWGIGPGDDVIVTPRSFMASVSCAVTVGARPVFADVDRDSQNLTAATIEAALTPNTRAIVLVHLAGWPADMDAICDLAASRNIKVLEDCAQAHGASWRGRKVGTIGDAGSYSFCTDKIMSTGGEGGLVTTNDESLWRAVWEKKDHGKSYDAVFNREHPLGFRWLHESFGTNMRMTGMQAAIGRRQLQKLDSWISQRRANAATIRAAVNDCSGLRIPEPPSQALHSCYKFYAFVRPEALREGWTRDRILSALVAEGVPGLSGSCSEIYNERAFDGGLRPEAPLPVARELGETSIMFPVHHTMTEQDAGDLGEALAKVLSRAQR